MKKLTLIFLTLFITSQSFSQNDSCLEFDGINDYVLFGDVNDLGTSDFTIEAWVYIKDSSGVGQEIINKGISIVGTPANAGYGLRVFDNQIAGDIDFHIGHSDGSTKFIEYDGLTINTWYHIAGVRSGKYLYLYLDGILIGSDSTTVVFDVNTNLPLAIGAAHKGGFAPIAEFMNGKIDEVRIWNIARTASEINASKDCAITSAEPNLVAVYNLNGSTGSSATDSSGFGNHGSLENGPIWSSSSVALVCAVGITEYEGSQTSIYPNPFQSEIHVNTVLTNASFRIFDLTGKIVSKGKLRENTIRVEELISGSYILEISDENLIIHKKIIKE